MKCSHGYEFDSYELYKEHLIENHFADPPIPIQAWSPWTSAPDVPEQNPKAIPIKQFRPARQPKMFQKFKKWSR